MLENFLSVGTENSVQRGENRDKEGGEPRSIMDIYQCYSGWKVL